LKASGAARKKEREQEARRREVLDRALIRDYEWSPGKKTAGQQRSAGRGAHDWWSAAKHAGNAFCASCRYSGSSLGRPCGSRPEGVSIFFRATVCPVFILRGVDARGGDKRMWPRGGSLGGCGPPAEVTISMSTNARVPHPRETIGLSQSLPRRAARALFDGAFAGRRRGDTSLLNECRRSACAADQGGAAGGDIARANAGRRRMPVMPEKEAGDRIETNSHSTGKREQGPDQSRILTRRSAPAPFAPAG